VWDELHGYGRGRAGWEYGDCAGGEEQSCWDNRNRIVDLDGEFGSSDFTAVVLMTWDLCIGTAWSM